MPQRWQAIIAVATCPPGKILTECDSTFAPRAGYSGTRSMVSVAFSPTPTTSIVEGWLILGVATKNRRPKISAYRMCKTFEVC